MKREILRKAVQLNMKHRRHKRWQKVVRGMAAIVVFITTYALILPAITMENAPTCGHEAHTHTDACYYTPHHVIGQELHCSWTPHNHEDACYDSEKQVICGYADYAVHTHEEHCRNAAGALVCQLPERKEHQHNADCYGPYTIYACNLQEGDGAHVHEDACYILPTLCQLEETEGHTHVSTCYGQAPLICQPETTGSTAETTLPEHTHTEECYGQPELTCSLAEAPAHTHVPECYGGKQLVCTIPEQEGHIHNDTCGLETGQKLICEKEEISLHTHLSVCPEENCPEETCPHILCWNKEGQLICQKPEVLSHQHTEDCFVPHAHTDACYEAAETGVVQICPYHVHEASCYDEAGQPVCSNPVQICGMEEHIHQSTCYITEEDNQVEIRFEVPEAYTRFLKSETTFPATYLLAKEAPLSSLENLPAITVVTPEGEEAAYLPEYHWITPDGFPADPEAPLLEDLVLTLQMYPVQTPEAAKLVTVTFANEDAVLLTKTVNAGTIASNLISTELLQQIDELQGSQRRFTGWNYRDSQGTEHTLISGETAVSEDTTYYAVFQEYVTLTLHDINDQGQETGGAPRMVSIPAGSSLAEMSDMILDDGTPINACIWYTEDGQTYTPEDPVLQPLALYTYTYSLKLKLHPAQEEEPVQTTWASRLRMAAAPEPSPQEADAQQDTITILKRSGSELTESDFLANDVNYTAYLWEDADGNNVDATDLLGTTMTSSYALTQTRGINYTIKYNISLVTNNKQLFGTAPTLDGNSTLSESYNTDDGSYTLRIPNPTQYTVVDGNKKLLYQFTGWKVGRNTVDAGETVTASWIRSNVKNGTLTLTGQWTAVPIKETVHFFVNLNCQVVDMEGNTSVPDAGEFTHSVFSTTMTVTGASMKSYWQGYINGGQYVLCRAQSATQTEAIDAKIRKLINGYDSSGDTYNGKSVWSSRYTGTKIFQVDDFPSDEHVLSVVRDMVSNGTVIRLNGVRLKAEELTINNFTVRWNVCKLDGNDGWHIDGVLVGKQGHLTVKKTFQGDDAAIESVKQGSYSITLDNTTNTALNDITLTLNPASQESAANSVGFSTHDAVTDTYTWVVPLQQENYYTIQENNYRSGLDAVQTSALYTIGNSPDAFSGWAPYPQDGIPQVKAYAYASDTAATAYQTVSIRNSYVKSDTLTIHKIDKDTGNGLAGISYQLSNPDGSSLPLYRKPGTSYYSMKATDQAEGFEPIADSIITTDRNGTIFMNLENGIFTLEEAFPTGYGGASKITVTVGVDSDGNVVFEDVSSTDSTIEVSGNLVDKDTATLTVRNVSFPTSITAKKIWLKSADAKPVTVALYRNGVDMGSDYHKVLSTANNWTHTWNDLPLFADGAAAKYTLREIKIGDTNYDPSADNDGYAGYIVAYDDMVYYKNGSQVSGAVWTDANGVTQYADNATLLVRNEVYRGQMVFQKVDGQGKPLAGATFRLYSDAAQTKLIAESTSDEYGRVIYENLMPDTYYVLKETNSPEGYVGGDSLYKVRLTSQGTTTVEDTATGQNLTQIVNYLDEATVELKKVSSFGTVLADAQFLLEKQEGNQWITVIAGQTNAEGLLPLETLRSGHYRLTETKAPDGFMPIPEPIAFTIDQGILTIDNPSTRWPMEQDLQTGTYRITVENKTGYELPKTGGLTTGVYTCSGISLITAALALLLLRRKKGGAPC